MARRMPDWSELQDDLLAFIARRLNLIEDYSSFRTVCKSWHSAATKNNFSSDLPRVPWLMLAEEEDNTDGSSCRKFFSLYNGMILKKKIPKASRQKCMESMGWLITIGEDEGEVSLLHPFSGVRIELPHQNTTEDYRRRQTGNLCTFFNRAVLSASPSHTSDYILMVIDGGKGYISFWKPGDLRWNRIILDQSIHPAASGLDVVYFNGYFYGVDRLGRIIVCDVSGSQSSRSHMVAKIPFDLLEVAEQLYILESLGSLFVVLRNGVHLRYFRDDCDRIPLTFIRFEDEDGEEDLTYGTTDFRVFQVDLASGKVTETRELGDRAFFVGYNASLSVQASKFPGIKPNHIYFTDHYFGSYLAYEEGGGFDMGVFNLAEGSIQPHYKGVSLSRISPPTWVTPTLY
ncbi:hypothetical protein AABB24_006188 [Solanum stoloniferum]|uniref:Ubiquitin-protein ligase n=3 Tax=Solanum stoloniferum TaxID=62892 RepID=A0ABD2V4D9_9SOLN|nr:probable F-box protein At1g65740 [Solanum verrucosum]